MSESDANTEEARKAYLKQLFGGALEPDERALVGTLEASPEGAAYAREARELKGLLSEVATVTPKPAYPKDRVRRFEEAVRATSRKVLRFTRWTVPGTSCITALFALLFALEPSWDSASLLLLTIAMLAFALLGSRIHHDILAEPDLFALLQKQRALTHSSWAKLKGWALILLLAGAFLAWAYERSGWSGILWFSALALLQYLLVRLFVKCMRHDPAAWAWWKKQV